MRHGLILFFFFASGISGLLYELVWIRTAGTVLGNTTYAIGAVVAVYMAGLALGAALGGRAADRRSGGALLRLYGLLEFGVALTALAVPFLLLASEPLFRLLWGTVGHLPALYGALRIFFLALILLPCTSLMGATLPVLVRYFSEATALPAREAGRAYAVNTFGGVAGTLAAGFWLIPAFGLRITTVGAAALNLAIGAASLAVARGGTSLAPVPPAPAAPVPRTPLVAAAVSGLAALVYEVAWTRAIVLSTGSTVYSFTLILAAFIAGLASGSALAARPAERGQTPGAALAFLQAAVGIAALLLLPALGHLPVWFSGFVDSFRRTFGLLLLAQAGVIFAFVFIPALLMGAVFPLACRLVLRDGGTAGRSVAAVYTWNTVGSIAGTLLGTFVLLPMAGPSGAVRAAAAANLLLSAWLFRSFWAAHPAALALPACALAALPLLPSWQPGILSSGSFLYGERIVRAARAQNRDLADFLARRDEILSQEWDPYGLVTVHRNADRSLSLRINGKVDASTGERDMTTQLFLGHLPLLHHPAPKDALVIGLGAGITLGAVERHPLERIDCVELSPAVIRAAALFSEANGAALADPRLRLVEGDGRNALVFGRQTYDVIISEPSNLWLSGMANLFTRDFFEEVKGRLRTGGIFCQWIHGYRLASDDFFSIVRTFFSSFEHGSVWEVFPGTDYILLGRREPHPLPWGALEARIAALRDVPEFSDPAWPGALGLAGHLVCDAAGARAAAGPGSVLTDDRCPIEYTAARSLYRDDRPALLERLDRVRAASAERSVYADPPESTRERRESRRAVAEAMRLYCALRVGEAMDRLARVPRRDRQTQEYFEMIAGEAVQDARRSADPGEAARLLATVPPGVRAYPDAQAQLAERLEKQGRIDEARAAARRALDASPGHARARAMLERLGEPR